jgi:hypothetical protein
MILDFVGELLSRAPDISSPPTQQIFLNNLIGIIERSAGHSINLFSDLVDVWSGKVRRLLSGQTKLRIEVLCHLCSKLDIRPIDLLCENEGGDSSKNYDITSYTEHPPPKLMVPWEEVECGLHTALQQNPPPSMEAAGRHLGYYPPKLQRHFPSLCEQIRVRYKTYIKGTHPHPKVVKRILRSALREHPPPSLQSVLRRLGCWDTGYYYYSHYFELCTDIARAYKENRNKPFDKDLTEEQLREAITEEPAPPFTSIAKRLGHSREFFSQKYPELVKAITSRYMHYRRNLQKEKLEKLRNAIREAVKEILASGLYVSESRVKESIQRQQVGPGRNSIFKQILREVKSEIGIGK